MAAMLPRGPGHAERAGDSLDETLAPLSLSLSLTGALSGLIDSRRAELFLLLSISLSPLSRDAMRKVRDSGLAVRSSVSPCCSPFWVGGADDSVRLPRPRVFFDRVWRRDTCFFFFRFFFVRLVVTGKDDIVEMGCERF